MEAEKSTCFAHSLIPIPQTFKACSKSSSKYKTMAKRFQAEGLKGFIFKDEFTSGTASKS